MPKPNRGTLLPIMNVYRDHHGTCISTRETSEYINEEYVSIRDEFTEPQIGKFYLGFNVRLGRVARQYQN